MKRKDIILIVGIVLITAVITFIVANKFFPSAKNRKQQVEVVEAISSDFNKPSTKYFNSGSIDPTQQITIGENNNQKPFNNSNGQ